MIIYIFVSTGTCTSVSVEPANRSSIEPSQWWNSWCSCMCLSEWVCLVWSVTF